MMDKKVLQKRKMEEERDSIWEKEKKKAELLREEKAKKIQMKAKAVKLKTKNLDKNEEKLNFEKPNNNFF